MTELFLGCPLGHSESYTVSVTTAVGVDLGLDICKIFKLGLSASVSRSEANGVVDTAGATCKGPWTYSMIMTPTMVEVSGTKNSVQCGTTIKSDKYTVQFPKLGSDKTPVINTAACACTNYLHWADEGPRRHVQIRAACRRLKEFPWWIHQARKG